MTNPVVVVSGVITPSDCGAAIGVEVWVDQHCVINCEHVDKTVPFEHTLEDADGDHELRIVMKHKQAAHTRIDDQGRIVQDAVLTVSDLEFDGVDIMQVARDHAEYCHDFNGSQAAGKHRFYGDIGCNGTVNLKFSTPAYLWLLEHL
jgi:precorrin-2 methylase